MNQRGRIMTALLYGLIAGGFLGGVLVPLATAAEDVSSQGTVVEHKDVHLSPEALAAAEGLPYEKLLSEEELVKTKIDRRDPYLAPEALSAAEGLPYREMMSPEEYVPVKLDPKDLELDREKMVTDDPSFVKGQEKY